MSWEGLEVLLSNYPYIKTDLEKLNKYIQSMNLKSGDIIDINHASILANIPVTNVKSILEKGAELGIFKRIYKLKCSVKEGFVYVRDEKYNLPCEFFCDLCGDAHGFNEKDVVIGYRLKFVYSNKDMDALRDKMPVMGYIRETHI